MRTPLGPAFENTYFIAFFQIKKRVVCVFVETACQKVVSISLVLDLQNKNTTVAKSSEQYCHLQNFAFYDGVNIELYQVCIEEMAVILCF